MCVETLPASRHASEPWDADTFEQLVQPGPEYFSQSTIRQRRKPEFQWLEERRGRRLRGVRNDSSRRHESGGSRGVTSLSPWASEYMEVVDGGFGLACLSTLHPHSSEGLHGLGVLPQRRLDILVALRCRLLLRARVAVDDEIDHPYMAYLTWLHSVCTGASQQAVNIRCLAPSNDLWNVRVLAS
jgi:hypothetical protein